MVFKSFFFCISDSTLPIRSFRGSHLGTCNVFVIFVFNRYPYFFRDEGPVLRTLHQAIPCVKVHNVEIDFFKGYSSFFYFLNGMVVEKQNKFFIYRAVLGNFLVCRQYFEKLWIPNKHIFWQIFFNKL